MISTLISYITYSQIWIVKHINGIYIGGNTTRAIFDFELEFFKFITYPKLKIKSVVYT